MSERQFDIVVFGATGFTGELVARYVAARLPRGKTWAIAGRNAERLESLRHELEERSPECAPAIVIADLAAPASLLDMAERTRIVLTTVGPYTDYGEPVVQACVEGGAHCFDLTGEPDFIEAVRARYHERARSKKLLIVHACGFGSVPSDVGAFYTAQHLPAHEEKSVRAYISTNARPSQGTLLSILRAAAKGRFSLLFELTRPFGKPLALRALAGRIHYNEDLGAWAIPTPVVDTWIVGQSALARPETYGPHFQYCQYLVVPHLGVVAALLISAGIVAGLARLPPARWLMERALARSSEGPSAEARSRMHFSVTFFGEALSRRVVTRVSGGEPGYEEASKIIAECGLLLLDETTPQSPEYGVASPIAALGNALVERLQARGIRFQVLEQSPPQIPTSRLTRNTNSLTETPHV